MLLQYWFLLLFLNVLFVLSPYLGICCFHDQDAYSEVAGLFAEFFRDLDIVPSDIIAGLVLLRQTQRAKRSNVLGQVSHFLISIIVLFYFFMELSK